MASECVFCRIAAGELPAEKLFEDDHLLAFRDLHPAAPQHVLLIPKEHIASFDDLQPEQDECLGRLLRVAGGVAARLGLTGGYRLVGNCGPDAGQAVGHLHVHLLGGRGLGWPPG
ncbi:MAG: histidine triad nucleotide-binding protein [Candidatus Eisenbacteria bacterium]|uniref:Histidine triad nucleotide-binding protein n=1 Tax=Eiseniibacteriota bacterium TaxID=2212470 RepID=A0A938BL23_UNCEI|nr:histidine triad nucleotide-binding protein [Candidatus Eisenbacteria bacterium]